MRLGQGTLYDGRPVTGAVGSGPSNADAVQFEVFIEAAAPPAGGTSIALRSGAFGANLILNLYR